MTETHDRWAEARHTAALKAAQEVAVDVFPRGWGRVDGAVIAMVNAALAAADAVLPPTPVPPCGNTVDHLAHRVPMSIRCDGLGEQVCNDTEHVGPWVHVPYEGTVLNAVLNVQLRCTSCGATMFTPVAP